MRARNGKKGGQQWLLFSVQNQSKSNRKMGWGHRLEKIDKMVDKGGGVVARQRWQEWAESEDNLSVLAAWARAGQTDVEIAKAIGISRSTLSEWKKKHDSIRMALSTGKDFANRLVENSLFKMTQGYYVTVQKAFKVKTVEYGADGKRKSEKEELETAEETEYIKPDPRTIIFYLENNMPEKYRKKLLELSGGEDGENIGMVVMNEAMTGEIKKLIEEEKENQNEKER